MISDEKLRELLMTDPERGMKALSRRYAGLVLCAVRARLSRSAFSKEDIEECAADTFTEFYLGIESFEPSKGSIRARLLLIARRNALDLLRKRYRELPRVPLEEGGDVSDGSVTIESALEENELKGKLLECVLGLEHPDREIIVRKFYLGQPSKEIARALSMSVSNVDTRTHRAIKKLREKLEAEYEDKY